MNAPGVFFFWLLMKDKISSDDGRGVSPGAGDATVRIGRRRTLFAGV